MLRVELQTNEIPDLFAQFKDVIDERYWSKRVALIKDDLRGRPFLANFLNRENAIALALARCSSLTKEYGRIPMQEAENRNLYPAMSLAAQALSIIDHSSKQEAARLVQRIRGAFKNPDDMRAIQLELMAATHFVQRGHSVGWPEMDGLGRFDLLVKDIGANGLEVECKSISEDKGRKVHRREALEFHHLIKQGLHSLSRRLQSGISVVLTVPGRLPVMHKQKLALAKQVVEAVLGSQNVTLNDGSDIRVSEFDMNKSKGVSFAFRNLADSDLNPHSPSLISKVCNLALPLDVPQPFSNTRCRDVIIACTGGERRLPPFSTALIH